MEDYRVALHGDLAGRRGRHGAEVRGRFIGEREHAVDAEVRCMTGVHGGDRDGQEISRRI